MAHHRARAEPDGRSRGSGPVLELGVLEGPALVATPSQGIVPGAPSLNRPGLEGHVRAPDVLPCLAQRPLILVVQATQVVEHGIGDPIGPIRQVVRYRNDLTPDDPRLVLYVGEKANIYPDPSAIDHHIVVREKQQIASCKPDSRVLRSAEPDLPFTDHPEPRVLPDPFLDHLGSGVRRSVVDDDDLELVVLLHSERPEAIVQVVRSVTGGDDDADGDRGVHRAACQPGW